MIIARTVILKLKSAILDFLFSSLTVYNAYAHVAAGITYYPRKPCTVKEQLSF